MTWLRRSLFILASWLAYGLLTPLYEAAAWLFSNGEWHTWRRQAVVLSLIHISEPTRPY